MIPCCPKCLFVLYVTERVMACLHCDLKFDNTDENRKNLLDVTERTALIKMRQELLKTGKWSDWPKNGSKKL